MEVGSNLYGSSLGAGRSAETLPVRVRALDSLARELGVVGQGLLKLDIQGGELEALRGAHHLLATSVDAVVVEVTIDPIEPGKPSYDDVHRFLHELGFTLFDNVGSWRSPESGMLLEQDVLLIKRDHPLAERRRRDATMLAEDLKLIQSAIWPLRRGGNGHPRVPGSDPPPQHTPNRASPF